MTLATAPLEDAALTGPAAPTTFTPVPPLAVRGPLRRAAGVVWDLLAVAGILLCIPAVIYAIAIPIALCLQLLSWVGRVF